MGRGRCAASSTLFILLFIRRLMDLMDWQEREGEWLSLDAELEMKNGEVVGTKTPTGHCILLDCRFETPFGKDPISIFFLEPKSLKCQGRPGTNRTLRSVALSRSDAHRTHLSSFFSIAMKLMDFYSSIAGNQFFTFSWEGKLYQSLLGGVPAPRWKEVFFPV